MRIGYILAGAWIMIVAGLTSGLVPAATAQTPLLSVDDAALTDTTLVSDGETFTLSVSISAEATELMGYDIAVVFNSDVIELLSVDEGALPLTSGHTTFFYSYDTGTPVDSVRVTGAILGTTVAGPGVLFSMTFVGHAPRLVGPQETDVEIVFSDLRTGVNVGIVHDVQNRHVIVEPPIGVQPVSWGGVKQRYR